MDYNLNRSSQTALPQQIVDILRKKIINGDFKPGEKLYSVRKLADKFKVSTLTVTKALDCLSEEKLIERLPMRGVFVSQQVISIKQRLNICVPYPLESISIEKLQNDNWSSVSELYRGLLSMVTDENISLQFVYFEDTNDHQKQEKQIESLLKFDAAVFFGASQLRQLQGKVAKMMPIFRVIGNLGEEDDPGIIPVNYDRAKVYYNAACHALECGAENIGCVFSSCSSKKVELFEKEAMRAGFARKDIIRINVSSRYTAYHRDIIKEIQHKHRLPDFIFSLIADLIPCFYESARHNKLETGKDFQLAGVSNGTTFASLYPRPSYYQIPTFEMGRKIMAEIITSLRAGKKVEALPVFETVFIQGMTTSPKNTH